MRSTGTPFSGGHRSLHLRVIAATTAAASTVLVAAAWAVWLLERHAAGANITSYPRALWWAMETITTVGYGDHHPVTAGGRLVAAGLMVVGLALVGVITATVVTWFFAELELVRDLRDIVEEEELEEATLGAVLERLRRIESQLDALERDGSATRR